MFPSSFLTSLFVSFPLLLLVPSTCHDSPTLPHTSTFSFSPLRSVHSANSRPERLSIANEGFVEGWCIRERKFGITGCSSECAELFDGVGFFFVGIWAGDRPFNREEA